MKREYIKCAARAAIMCFKRGSDADFARADAIDAHNTAIAERAFTAIMNGHAEYAYIRDGKRLTVYTRSLRGNFVQASYFFEIDGDMVATMHSDIHGAQDMEHTFTPGKYINIAA